MTKSHPRSTSNKYSDTKLIDHIKNLFPYCRSITGEGTRKTLKYFENYFTILRRITFKSGEAVFDWKVPPEWTITDAFLVHLDTGRKYAEFSSNNLHVVGYSEPINKVIDFNDLNEHIYTLPDQPNLIPYVTSYYQRAWGFCMSHNDKNNMPKGLYKVFIDSGFNYSGKMDMSHGVIEGKSSNEIFFSSYVCHPSMANNELSGPVLLCKIIDYINTNYPKPINSYRFILLPETIGSIAYLSRYLELLVANVVCGFNLSCVGDERAYSHVQSPHGNTLADLALESALIGLQNVKSYSFLERGSDERQYCSPLVGLPLCTFCRSKFGEYSEYHTSADLPEKVVTDNGLNQSFDVLKSIIDAFEIGIYPIVLFPCEPMLGKRQLYRNISIKSSNPADVRNRRNIIAYCTGKNTLFAISKITNIPLKDVIREVRLLTLHRILRCYQERK